MSEYFTGLVACPECGDIRQGNNRENCRRCWGTGHISRMFSMADLTTSIENHERDGYHGVAIKRSLIRDALMLWETKVL